jgi:hypothetical protein
MGAYPVGTVVALDTGELCLVQRPPLPAAALDRPVVRVLEGPREGTLYNLADKSEGGLFLRSVVKIINPGNQGMLAAVDPSLLVID